jgi:exopolysaccharide production protein ExoQ
MSGRPAMDRAPPSPGEQLIAFLILLFPCMGTFFAPETYFAPQSFSLEAARQPAEVGFQFGRMAFILILIWLIPCYLAAPRQMARATLRSIVPILLAIWMIASALWAADAGASFNRSGRILILVLFAVYLTERYTTDEIVRLVSWAGTAAILCSIFAVAALPEYAYSGLMGYEAAWRGALLHKNSLGALMTVLFLFGLFALYSRTNKAFACFILIGSLFLIIMSRSATSLLVLLVTIATAASLILLNAFGTRLERIFLAIAAASVLVVAYLAQPRFEEIFALVGRDPSLTGRTDVWDHVATLAAERPILGYGHVFWAIDSLERERIWLALGWAAPHAHNMVLDLRLQLGLIGLGIAALLFIIALWHLARMLLRNTPPMLLLWPLIIVTTLFRGLSETYLVDPDSCGLFWCTLAFAGMAKASARISARRPLPAVRNHPALAGATLNRLKRPRYHARSPAEH